MTLLGAYSSMISVHELRAMLQTPYLSLRSGTPLSSELVNEEWETVAFIQASYRRIINYLTDD